MLGLAKSLVRIHFWDMLMPQMHPVCGSKDRVPVIEMRMDELGRRYYWNHTEMTSDWKPPPPQIGFWQRLMDYRRVFLSYKQHGDAMRFLANVCPRLPTACFSAVH